MKSDLSTANQAFRKGDFTAAMAMYVSALLELPQMCKTIAANIARNKKRYLDSRITDTPLKIIVCGWELAHNAAGRAHTLAEIYQDITSDVQIVGSIFPRWGRAVWEPIQNTSIPIHSFVVDPEFFIAQSMELVAQHPADVVHLSKPRGSNIFFGILYKLIWGAKVILDIDEEELVFTKADTALTVREYLKEYPALPPLDQLADDHWTRLAVGLAGEFDAVTVSNTALQRRYSGIVIGHGRDPRVLNSSPELRQKSRAVLGIQPHQKVVLFSGTPRPHKGVFEVAQAIQALKRNDIIFVIAGSFGEKNLALKATLEGLKGVNYLFLENQPISALASTLAVADCCVLFQDISHPRSTYQIPAKLSDALAMGIPVLAGATPALEDIIAAGAIIPVSADNIVSELASILNQPNLQLAEAAHCYFTKHLSLNSNAQSLRQLLDETFNNHLSPDLIQLINNFAKTAPVLNALYPLTESRAYPLTRCAS